MSNKLLPDHTDMCIFTVKSVIKYYTEQNTAVYTCLLDARKAFDRVNHWTLFAKLIDTQAPLLTRVTILVSNAKRLHKMGKLLFTLLYYLQWCAPEWYSISETGLGSSTVDQVLKYTKYPKYIPSTSTGQVLIF